MTKSPDIRSDFLLSTLRQGVSQVSAPDQPTWTESSGDVNSDDRTTVIPVSGSGSNGHGRPGGRAARRAADRHAGRGRRGRRRG
ncbi:hypothetical protein, partial [Streptomyces sp. CBMA123]|uniref:hypothetical protein n=1 Tax=Streptomyces sp. CBMA123 TaxID=1896313 RepID=UPI001CB7CD2C